VHYSPVANAAFTDVSTSTQTKLDYLISKGVVSGESSTFRPTDIVNRAESLKLIIAASQLDLNATANATFTDVKKDSWYAGYVYMGAKYGIVKGYADGSFKPEQKVNKGEFVTMLYRMHSTLRDDNYVDLSATYADVKSSDWYSTSATWSKEFLGGTTFDASKDLTREMTAEIVYSYMLHFKVDKKLAFGNLMLGTSYPNTMSARPENGGGGMGMAEDPLASSGSVMTESGMTMPDIKEMPPVDLSYPYYTYETTYEYTGPALAGFPESVEVTKAINPPMTAVNLSGILSDLGNVAKVFSTMGGVEMGYMTFSPAVKDGFMYSVDKSYGTFGINTDWRTNNPAMYETSQPLTSEPVDSEVTAIANKFLTDKGISTLGYGAPVVDKSWKLYRMEGDMEYIPDYYTVNYPKLVQDSPLYGMGGYYDQSLSVSVLYSTKSVTGVSGYLPKLEITSQYEGRTWDEVLTEAKAAGDYGNYIPEIPEGATVIAQTTKVTLTSARKVMMSVYNYEKMDDNGNPTLHFVPAVMFSGTSVTTSTDGSEPYTNPDVKIVVPAVNDLEAQG